MWKSDPIITVVWFFSTILISWQRGSRCHDAAKDIAAASYTLLLMVYVQYVVTVLLPVRLSYQPSHRDRSPYIYADPCV